MMQSEIVCGRHMSARASSAAAWLVATQIKRPESSPEALTNINIH